MRVNNRSVFKILCISSAVIALVVLFLTSIYLPLLHTLGKCGAQTEHYITAKVACSVAFIGSFLQIVWAFLLLLVWMEDVKKYFIGHITFGTVTFVVAVIIIINVCANIVNNKERGGPTVIPNRIGIQMRLDWNIFGTNFTAAWFCRRFRSNPNPNHGQASIIVLTNKLVFLDTLARMADMKLIFKILCIVSIVIAAVLLIVAVVYLASLGSPSSRCGNTSQHYKMAIAAGSLAIVGSLLQIVLALLLLLVWKDDMQKYFIFHVIIGTIILIATILVCIHGGIIDCAKCEAFLAFLIIDWLWCFISAVSLCAAE
ncbi:unnamed protein product, partial [Allacma fusca]